MNDAQRKATDDIVSFWSEVKELQNRFSGLWEHQKFEPEELTEILVSAIVRIVPDDTKREEMVVSIVKAAKNLPPDFPIGETVRTLFFSVLERIRAPRLKVVS